ncbi:MAG TPA: peptidase E [Anaerolineae bacterium]|nr:peptidase E [Anaerolineae bacterium]
MTTTRHIIAMGHGGFSMDADNLVLDQYICTQTGKARPKVCFLPQASGEAAEYIIKFYKAFTTLDAVPSHLSLFRPPTADLESFLLEKDAIYVGGGNTKSMLALWRVWGLDAILRKAWQQGVILAGLSAGAICWFEQGSTDSVPGRLSALECLGYLKGSCCPHYDGEAERRPTYQQMVAAGEILPGYGIDEGAAMHFRDDELHAVVASHPNVAAYAVEVMDGVVQEKALPVTYLGRE